MDDGSVGKRWHSALTFNFPTTGKAARESFLIYSLLAIVREYWIVSPETRGSATSGKKRQRAQTYLKWAASRWSLQVLARCVVLESKAGMLPSNLTFFAKLSRPLGYVFQPCAEGAKKSE